MNSKIELLQLEIQSKQRELVELRKEVPLKEIKNYHFTNKHGKSIDLLTLFGDSEELLIVHNMGQKCRYCTMWADGFRGYNDIISDRMPWVLTSPDHYHDMKDFAESRSWNFNCVSYNATTFAKDLGFEYEKDDKIFYKPGASALIKKENNIYIASQDSFGPGDLYNPAWHFFDLFPKGADDWIPKYSY